MEKITGYLIQSTVTERGLVRAWQEEILLPTYAVGEEEKNPIFLEKRVYQGSSGAVYPYPVIEKIYDDKQEKPYKALFLENIYIKIMILPELGGRIQMAYDKINKRHFVYYNQVIKPALVGLTGPWISGGIEFNWPQHHRPSTFLPTDYLIEENADGSKTVWCNEVERMFRTKGMQGFTLYPDKAYIEVNVKVYNRTPLSQTFLWWANPAVAVNDYYKSVFPPDVHAVFDHGKRDVSSFPIATGIYYKQDYSQGVDISKYKNIPVPTSYMAIESKYDFIGGYEDDTQCGLLHVSDHHVSTGKKQWTWGNGDFGKAWDRNLTDEDGPYIELMTGVYTDNQPDFSWLQPYEEKSWKQYFMPYTKVGYVKNATKDAAVNIEVNNGSAKIILYTSSEYQNLTISLKNKEGLTIFEDTICISPSNPYEAITDIGETPAEDLLFELKNNDGELMLSYQAEETKNTTPNPAKAALKPEEITSIEQLFLTGLHLEQYRHATYNPMDYYKEALSREPSDVRCNNALGLLLLRKGKFAESVPYFRRAIETLTERNPNPYDGEPFYNLGSALKLQGDTERAYDAFFKSTWNAAWQSAGYFSLAQIDCIRQDWKKALEKTNRSLIQNWHNHKARQLKISILRKLEKNKEALSFTEESLKIDPFNIGCHFEKYLLTGNTDVLKNMKNIMSGIIHPYIEYALDYVAAGLYQEADIFLNQAISDNFEVYPMVYYVLGYNAFLMSDISKARIYYQKASEMNPDKCFPNKIEEVNILRNAILINPSDSKAFYYLGNFWYAARQYEEAVSCWEKSTAINNNFPTVLRNLSLAYYNKLNLKEKARKHLEQAYRLDTSDARILMELDLLNKKTGKPYRERLSFLEQYLNIAEQRDDLYLERITLYNQLGDYQKASELISSRHFHPWEGGEGKVTKQYVISNLQLAKKAIDTRLFDKAASLLHKTDKYPENLGEGKLANAEENEIDYYKGIIYSHLGDKEKSLSFFRKATKGSKEPQQAFYYNDQQPDNIFYQGLAWRALGDENKAQECFQKLITHGKKHMEDNCSIDYFAVSLPDLAVWEDDLNIRNKIHCNYVIGLGYLGLNDERATEYLGKVLELDINHQGAQIHIEMAKQNKIIHKI